MLSLCKSSPLLMCDDLAAFGDYGVALRWLLVLTVTC